eukprot:TRINITY_DN26058_c0_g1_i1.p1 TRINITY_DN26058_c0_g1~~TRINITY_DN26058_c0_g1_i1.p1  ORF type:complete len:276 (-),score=44.46 TRINITY_DN26058_c0_g1_i1:57-884(-)
MENDGPPLHLSRQVFKQESQFLDWCETVDFHQRLMELKKEAEFWKRKYLELRDFAQSQHQEDWNKMRKTRLNASPRSPKDSPSDSPRESSPRTPLQETFPDPSLSSSFKSKSSTKSTTTSPLEPSPRSTISSSKSSAKSSPRQESLPTSPGALNTRSKTSDSPRTITKSTIYPNRESSTGLRPKKFRESSPVIIKPLLGQSQTLQPPQVPSQIPPPPGVIQFLEHNSGPRKRERSRSLGLPIHPGVVGNEDIQHYVLTRKSNPSSKELQQHQQTH